jgi:lipopolysaccharide export system protein LptA
MNLSSTAPLRARLCPYAAALCLLAAPAVHAEKADRDKPINMEADHMQVDDAKHVEVFEGKVVMTQGTLLLRADKIVVTQDAEGFRHGVATVAPGALAYFHEKRDGVDEYVEGWGERIEYDSKTDKAELFVHARLKRVLDEVHGNYISYDGKSDFYTVNSGEASGNENNPQGRVRMTVQPKKKEPVPPAKGDSAVPVKSAAQEKPVPAGPDPALKASPAIANPRPKED